MDVQIILHYFNQIYISRMQSASITNQLDQLLRIKFGRCIIQIAKSHNVRQNRNLKSNPSYFRFFFVGYH